MQQEKEAYPVVTLCRTMKVTRSSFYQWQKDQANSQAIDPEVFRMEADAQQIFSESDSSYGSRRMAKALRKKGYKMGRYQARSLMCSGLC